MKSIYTSKKMFFCICHRKTQLSTSCQVAAEDMNPDCCRKWVISAQQTQRQLPPTQLDLALIIEKDIGPLETNEGETNINTNPRSWKGIVYPLNDLWLYFQNGTLLNEHSSKLSTTLVYRVDSALNTLKDFSSKQKRVDKTSTERTERLTLMSLWIFFCACK